MREGLSNDAAEVVRQVIDLAWGGCETGRDREALAQVLDLFPAYYEVLEWMLADVMRKT